jgi:DNA-binding MarR family transcriptional regulator
MNQYLADHDIPDDLKEDVKLNQEHLKLYSLIKSCEACEGYCTYTDKQLAEQLGHDTSKIKRLLKRLSERGYIVRQKEQEGMVRSRKIFIREKKEA